MSGNVVETLIGAVVLAVAALFLVFAYSTAGVGGFNDGYHLLARFDRVDGLTVGGDVRMSGIKIGTITEQQLDPETYRAIIRFSVDTAVKLPEDTAARITSQGLLGGNYLSLEPGGAEQMLQDGQEIRFTQGSVNLMDLIGQAIFSAGTGGGQGAGGAQGGVGGSGGAAPAAPGAGGAARPPSLLQD